MIREGDYILIVDEHDNKYLQIGEVVGIEYFAYSSDVRRYLVRFSDASIIEYTYELKSSSKILMFERN